MRSWRRPRSNRSRLLTGLLALALLAGAVAWAAWPRTPGFSARALTLTVHTGPHGSTPVALDLTYYRPRAASAAHPTAAVLLAHGFGGTKDSVASDARDLADRGYAVLTWTAEGFGRSGGQIHLDSPDWEVKDAEGLVSWLAARPEVLKDGPGDPRVGVVGASYGGALALLLAGDDRRVDAVVAEDTWNDLAGAFLPESTGAGPERGVFKRAWAGLLFGEGGAPFPGGSTRLAPADATPACGRFAPDVCQAYLSVAASGVATGDQIALLRRRSPASVLSRITAPTLLVQGEADSLFPLSEADANARGIAAHGTPVQVAWYTGGHDGGRGPQSDQDRLRSSIGRWLDHYLLHRGGAPGTAFTYSRVAGIEPMDGGAVAPAYSVARYPGLSGQRTTTVRIAGPPQPVVSPPGGTPAAVSVLPGAGGDVAVPHEVPGQHADFLSAPLPATVSVVGAPKVRIRVASPTGEAVLFVKLYDLDPAGRATLPEGLVAPVRLVGLPASIAAARPVTVTLPAIVHDVPAGHRLRVTVATSDQAYATPDRPAVDTVAAGPTVALPVVRGEPIPTADAAWRWALAGLVAALALALITAIWIGRRRRRPPSHSAVTGGEEALPLVVEGLRKEYGDGLVAVSRVDFVVGRGQVVGLLGPNGAGKTTTLRMLLGLVRPSAGSVRVFGQRMVPGAPALSRVGALVEGPGFLPHLSGLANLRLFWRATGRPEADARLDQVLEIAALGSAVHRRVGTYSHGMKQRLAVAQAMLGMPDLLVLDEPTDGLDPPQIVEMRRVLRRYVTGGRAVLVSSHLLAEVERTCTHVVVLHRGEVVAAGPVNEVVGDSPSVQLEVSDPAAAAEVLRRAGVQGVTRLGDGSLVAELDGRSPSILVAALVRAGVGVSRVVPRRRLEDAFLALVGGEARSGPEAP
ncbi:MAG TPA: alpha/beta fold hydrolase [Candidatus Dormibacteraeota bacterium]|jgi:ABC-2 type transport system ATP-binding protein|nr:alpha/beta fold hydrolase [Candidatus Dormibacteraeota bacterium]